jgi:hypothetical protein
MVTEFVTNYLPMCYRATHYLCTGHKALNYKVKNELAGIWKEAAMICCVIPPRNLTGQPEDIHEMIE